MPHEPLFSQQELTALSDTLSLGVTAEISYLTNGCGPLEYGKHWCKVAKTWVQRYQLAAAACRKLNLNSVAGALDRLAEQTANQLEQL